MTRMQTSRPAVPLTPLQWTICAVAALGFAFDSYELLMLPIIVRPALADLLGVAPNSLMVNEWVGTMQYIPAVAGGIFGLLGGYLTDLLGRRRVLVWSILLYAISAVFAGMSTSVGMLLFWRCCTFVGVCVEFVAAVAWLSSCSPIRSSASGSWVHAGLRLDRRHHGDGRVLPDRHLTSRRSQRSRANRKRGATRWCRA
jgi:MFS family permease